MSKRKFLPMRGLWTSSRRGGSRLAPRGDEFQKRRLYAATISLEPLVSGISRITNYGDIKPDGKRSP
jgi:hypothetical protein